MSLWINYMQDEYNHNHHHSGQLTWVIYLETHDIEKLERRSEYKVEVLGPGGICFHYGEDDEWNTHNLICCKEGYLWMFCIVKTRSNTF